MTAAVSLLVLAGGMGSRFGGDKQLATVGNTGRPLLYFSVMDAYRAGIRHLVLVIRQNLQALFIEQVLPTLPADLKVDFVVQHLHDIPADCVLPTVARTKPWGTAHAVWSARRQLTQPFIVINADDYYGADAMLQLVDHFSTPASSWAMVAYPLALTLSEHGGVNRGCCQVENGQLLKVAEWTEIHAGTDGVLSGLDEQGVRRPLSGQQLVSMNIWGFTPNLLTRLETQLRQFFQAGPGEKAESYLPVAVDDALQHGQQLAVMVSTDAWRGITYPADLAALGSFFDNKI
ncbi:nucleotidyltransferase family protein [Rheinheimera texasensis]|uniref:nucleotidyltransferase family protein n=1 Tax=Rheinheimera texasensis TaxID=306205 RepID=UPI0004E2463E|nr:NTP transferase domain-containing protein [Rheinheimera texasensis]